MRVLPPEVRPRAGNTGSEEEVFLPAIAARGLVVPLRVYEHGDTCLVYENVFTHRVSKPRVYASAASPSHSIKHLDVFLF